MASHRPKSAHGSKPPELSSETAASTTHKFRLRSFEFCVRWTKAASALSKWLSDA